MPTTPEFDDGYKRLNAEQRETVDAIEGPVFVVAGPGTGKTQILILRIANILRQTDTPPESILALTYTEAGASEMRARLARLIGSRGNRVRIHTFHGFAESLIARYPDAFPRIAGGQIASDVERAEIFDEVLLHTDVEQLRPFGAPLLYHPFVSRAIQDMKRENATPDVLQEMIAKNEAEYEAIPDKVNTKGKYEGKLKGDFVTLEKKLARTRDLLAVYEAYEAELEKRHRYDYEDVILEAVRALTTDEAFRREVQETIFYVHADEHQDANRAQNALLELLVEHDERPNLFVVGDEKQAIYRFQGADLDNVHYFRERFPDTKIIALVSNYRSNQTILDSALSLIVASPDERLSRVKLVAAADATSSKPIRLVSAPSPTAEMDFLVAEVQALLSAGADPSEIAILARRNQDVAYVADALLARGITVGRGTENALHNRFVAALIRLLGAIVEPRDEALAALFALPGFGLSGADIWRIMDAAKREKMPAMDVLKNEKVLEMSRVSGEGVARAQSLRHTLDDLARMASTERPATVASAALKASGLMDAMLSAPDKVESIVAVRELLKAFGELSEREHDALLPRSLELLKLHEERGIALTKNAEDLPGLVRVMTVHRAKGREFGYVFVPRMTDRAWSTRNRPEHFYLPGVLTGSVELEDERRLLYVAITRAKRACVLSYATTREDGKDELPCELLEELDTKLVERESYDDAAGAATSASGKATNATARHESDLVKRTARASIARGEERAAGSQMAPSKDDLSTLRQAFLAQGLSPTALNNYLDCPWHYFYVNLLRIPEAENKWMLFGTAIHAALKAYADRRQRGEEMGADYLISTFNRQLSRSPLTSRDITELEVKGKKALEAWWKEHAYSWPEKAEAELPIQTTLALNGDTELIIRGKLDRVDTVPSGVRVIDYKTGKHRSRNEIMGKTGKENADYYRQLTFYKLLLEKNEPSRTMIEGVIEFVEPDEKGNLRSEPFEISDAEVRNLEQLIEQTAHDIMTLSFWNQKCDDAECPWCPLRFSL